MFRGRLGAGEVIGRSSVLGSVVGIVKVGLKKLLLNEGGGKSAEAKLGGGKLLRGMTLTGESGDDDGEGSESGDESVVDRVVVGEDSVDSDICVDVLS